MTTGPKDFQKIVKLVHINFPQYNLQSGRGFAWSPSTKTITYNPLLPDAISLLLHELAHGELAHTDYQFDIDLIRHEAAAWEYAERLASNLNITISNDVIQDSLDTYRDWLHQRSLCPYCKAIGLQSKKNTYSCINCKYSWRVNDARQCQLKRFRLQDQNQIESTE